MAVNWSFVAGGGALRKREEQREVVMRGKYLGSHISSHSYSVEAGFIILTRRENCCTTYGLPYQQLKDL